MARIIGQSKAIKELRCYMDAVKKGSNLTLAILGPSGYGKTTLANYFLWEVTQQNWSKCIITGPPAFNFNTGVRYIFLDEAHEITNPEPLYALMDSKKHTFVFATNESGALKPPLLNRCFQVLLEQYTLDELAKIVHDSLSDSVRDNINDECIFKLAQICGGNPRIAKTIAERVSLVVDTVGIPNSVEELVVLLDSVLNISEDGLNPYDKIYLECLKKNNGKASLNLLCSLTGFSQATILRDIEPKLIAMNRILINPQGRTLNNDSVSIKLL
jgi:Holliday junction resolvasome RuvABC ATP-dependent DNA helicase subunit